MKVELKTWASLGLAGALVGAGLSGCAGEGEGGEGAEGGEAAQTAQSSEMGEGEGGEGGEGEGGEGGEGGVSIAEAGSDPIVYASALAVAESHAIAARDAFAAGEVDPAAEMFGHPVTEVLAELEPVLTAQGVADFKPLFFDASAAVLAGETPVQINDRFDAIVAALRSAEESAPDNGTSAVKIDGGVTADMIDRAIAMYPQAIETGIYAPYLDGYGYYKAAQARFDASSDAILAENAGLHGALTEALGLLAEAYPEVEQPETLSADQAALLAAGSKVLLNL